MKTKLKLRLATLVATMLFSFTSRAQIYATNNLNCDVTIFYEMYEFVSTACSVVCSASLTIPANTVGMLIPNCNSSANPCDACIVITDIGGCSPASNHSSNNVTCPIPPYGQSGFSGCCTASGSNWTASQTPGSWTIN